MKAFTTVLKILAVLAAIVGVVYVAATYGEQIVAWARNLLEKMRSRCCCCDGDCCEGEIQASEADFEG